VTKQHNYFFVYSDTKIGLLENGKDIIERRGGGKEKPLHVQDFFSLKHK
jgi:hypothetical protein